MMSLVDYGSGSEDDDIEIDQHEQVNQVTAATSASTSSNSVTFKADSAFLLKFEDLPEPQPEAPAIPESFEEDEGPIPPKKVYEDMEIEEPPGKSDIKSFGNLTARKIGGKMKIAAPSLKDFQDEEEDTKKKTTRIIQPSNKRSGLFSILPQPKMPAIEKPSYNFTSKSSGMTSNVNNDDEDEEFTSSTANDEAPEPAAPIKPKSNPFVPHVVKQTMLGKRPPPSKLDEIKAKYLKQEANVQIVSRKNQKRKADDESDEEGSDFFSFAALNEKIPDDPSLRLPDYVPPSISDYSAEPSTSEVAEEASSSVVYQPNALSDEDMLKYINEGKRFKKDNISFIDVSADAIRPDSTEWIKNITAEEAGYNAPPSGNAPGGMSKRKHQITYLAFQAKAREQELKNQWAQNKHNKRVTQSKYGF